MAKSYKKEAEHRLEKIKHCFKTSGAAGFAQARPYFSDLGDCYSKSAANRSGDAAGIQAMYLGAQKLMDTMKRRAEGKPDVEPVPE